MRIIQFFSLIICTLSGSAMLSAQRDKGEKEEKFDQELICPFENGMGGEPKKPIPGIPR